MSSARTRNAIRWLRMTIHHIEQRDLLTLSYLTFDKAEALDALRVSYETLVGVSNAMGNHHDPEAENRLVAHLARQQEDLLDQLDRAHRKLKELGVQSYDGPYPQSSTPI